MRKKFFKDLAKKMAGDENVWFLYGDVGYGFVEEFHKRFPERTINCGIAEQNMVGVAAGLAHAGKKVYVYSIANFITFRCLEQIRNDIVAPNLDVTIVGVGGKDAYHLAGISHNCPNDEDIKVMDIIGAKYVRLGR